MLSSTYICPVRGLAGLEPPEPDRLGAAAKIAGELGLERFFLPIPEGVMVSSVRTKIAYLDGMVRVLDRLEEVGIKAWIIAPARRILGLDWVPPYLIKGSPDPKGPPVFIEGKLRQVRPYNWWKDPSIIEKRIGVFREIISALSSHPAIGGWVILDRSLEWPKPEPEEAELIYQSYQAEIRDKDEEISIFAGLGWQELLQPETALHLVSRLKGIRLAGLDIKPKILKLGPGLAGELHLAAYLAGLSAWLFDRPVIVEAGWSGSEDYGHDDDLMMGGAQLRKIGISGLCWTNLVDPEKRLLQYPPWNRGDGVERAGLLNTSLEPKDWVEGLFEEMNRTGSVTDPYGFIDIEQKEYLEAPRTHFIRLWDHFREFIK